MGDSENDDKRSPAGPEGPGLPPPPGSAEKARDVVAVPAAAVSTAEAAHAGGGDGPLIDVSSAGAGSAAGAPVEPGPAKKPDPFQRTLREAPSSEPQLPPGALNRTQAVFVPWTGLEERCAQLRTLPRRFIVVAGEPGVGRFTAGVWMGLRLLGGSERPRIVVPLPTHLTGPDLCAWLESSERQKRTVYVLRQPLGSEFTFGTLTHELLQQMGERLEGELDSWLIMTAKADQGGDLEPPGELVRVPPLSPDRLRLVLDKHLDWLRDCEPGWGLGSSEDRLRGPIDSLIATGKLTTSPQVARFLGKLPGLLAQGLPEGDDELALRLAGLARNVAGEVTQAWFARLTPNEQFMALLVEAFRGIPRSGIENLYCREAERLSREGDLLADPRRFGFDDLYRQINVQVAAQVFEVKTGERIEVQYLEFADDRYRREALRQMRSRHHLLWGVVRSVIAEVLKAVAEVWQAPQRQALGEVIARLGIHRPEDLEGVLAQLAEDPSGTIASVPGYILRGVCLLDEPDYRLVHGLLEKWVKEPDHVWAATAALWRVYAELAGAAGAPRPNPARRSDADRLMRDLEKLATEVASSDFMESLPSEEADFLSYAVARMFQAAPEAVGRLVQSWLAAGGLRAKAGRRAARRLYVAHTELESLDEPRFRALLELVGSVLPLDRELVDTVLGVLLQWTQREDWQAALAGSLLTACNRARDGERDLLRRAMATLWLRAHQAKAREIARAVIGRARLMDGVPTDLPGAGRASLLVDASEAARENDTADRLTQELFEFFGSQVDLGVAQLGNRRALCEPGGKLEVEALPARRSAARIVMPWIEQLLPRHRPEAMSPGLHFVFVVHWEGLVDGEDVQGTTDFPVVSMPVPVHHLEEGDAAAHPDSTRTVPFYLRPLADAVLQLLQRLTREENERRSEVLLSHADPVLSACLSRALAERTPECWWALLAASSERLAAATAAAEDRWTAAGAALDALVGRLDEVPSDPSGPDPMRIALGLVQWMAATDLPQTVRRLCDWMRLESRNPRGNFAAAAATMLLRIHFSRMLPVPGAAAQAAPPVGAFLPLLDLAPALARRRSALGMRVLLSALRCWLGNAAWAAALLRHPSLLRAVDASPRRQREQMAKWLDFWTAEPIEALGEKRVPEAAGALRLRLKWAVATRSMAQVALGPTVVILVHHSGHEGARKRLGEIAWRLYGLAESQRKPGGNLPQFVFVRAGCRHPLAVTGEGAAREAFRLGPHATGILAPTVEQLRPLADLMLVLADGGLVDAEDWLEPEGTGRLELFWDNRRLAPPSLDPAWVPLYQSGTEPEAVGRVVERLRARLNRASL